MRPPAPDSESWKSLVLKSMPAPAWLNADAPQSDVVLSSRARYMRNLVGLRFPHAASNEELQIAMKAVLAAAKQTGEKLEAIPGLTLVERNHLVGFRLVSHDFHWQEPGRALLLDERRALSVMINEEDHLRIQALTAGWSITGSDLSARRLMDQVGEHVAFARHPKFGYLAASPFNCGEGRRLSCMLHLVGLATANRLTSVLKALSVQGLTARGLFGESSRAVGAFLQVSVIQPSVPEFVGAVEYLIKEERLARLENQALLTTKAEEALAYLQRARTLDTGAALRLLGWIRYASVAGLDWAPKAPRSVDYLLAMVDVHQDERNQERAAERAKTLRRLMGV